MVCFVLLVCKSCEVSFFIFCWPQKALHGLFCVYRNVFFSNAMYVGSLHQGLSHHTPRYVYFECITLLSFYKTVKADYFLQVKLLRGMKNIVLYAVTYRQSIMIF